MIDYEPRAHQQIPLLMALGEERAALHKAVESGNTDLVYTVILRLRESMTLWDFQVSKMICYIIIIIYKSHTYNSYDLIIDYDADGYSTLSFGYGSVY